MKNEMQTLERDDATVDVGANDVDYKKALGVDPLRPKARSRELLRCYAK